MLRASRNRALPSRSVRILVLGNLLGLRIPPPDLVRTLLGEPDRTVGGGHGRVNTCSSLIRHRELLDLTGQRVESSDPIGRAVIGHPEIPLMIRSGAPWHAVRPRQLVLDIYDLHGFIAERAEPEFLILGQIGWGPGERRVRPERRSQISDYVCLVLVGEASNASEEEMHRGGHVIDSVSPARLITGHRSHASFKSVAGRAYAEQRLFSVRLGQQLLSLIKREV